MSSSCFFISRKSEKSALVDTPGAAAAAAATETTEELAAIFLLGRPSQSAATILPQRTRKSLPLIGLALLRNNQSQVCFLMPGKGGGKKRQSLIGKSH